MARKNLLSDSDFTRGRDNRFGNTIVIGRVAEIVCNEEGANARVALFDKLDHTGQPLITKPIPVWQHSSGGKRSFMMPRVGQPCVLVKLPNGTSDYHMLGTFYTKSDPPPVTDPKLDYVEYDDGSTMQFNASNGELTWKLKGAMTWDNDKGASLKFKELITIEATESGITLKAAAGQVLLDSQTVKLKGSTVFIEGNITHTGNMTTSGTHIDTLGHHTSGVRLAELEQRLQALEQRVAQLEARLQ